MSPARECCGLIIIEKGKEKFFPCKNDSQDPKSFIINPGDYAIAESKGTIVSVVHSHCFERAIPSQIDLVSCENSKLPWHIVSLPNEEWHYFEPSGYKASLVGRQYQYGVLDCYTLVVDWYKENFGIQLNEHLGRPDKWWLDGKSLFMDGFKQEGFERIDIEKIQHGDVVIMQVGANVPNHVGVYLKGDILLHHHQGRLSTRDVYGGYYRKHTVCAVRHSGVKL